MDIEIKKNDINGDITVDTFRSGRFKFQIGIDLEEIDLIFNRVVDAHNTFARVPILPEIAKKLEDSVLVSSVFGTNTIEGGTITEDEIRDLFLENRSAKDIEDEKRRRVANIKEAYDIAEEQAQEFTNSNDNESPNCKLSEALIIRLHKTITGGIPHPKNISGQYRNNPKGEYTQVGDIEHGGVYTPPKCLEDIQALMKAYITWINSPPLMSLNPILRAHLAHYYFERIHPFYDGNGRVGRVIEAIILKCSGMNYAPFALASSYLERIDEYFLVFNQARKAEQKKQEYPNTIFLQFCLNRLRTVFDKLHENVNNMISLLLFTNALNKNLVDKDINIRQHTIVNNLLNKGIKHDLTEVRKELWYSSLYTGLTTRTRERDLKKLIEKNFIVIQDKSLAIKLP